VALNVADPDSSAAASGLFLGETTDQVVAALGSPNNVADLGWRQIYLYDNLKLTFVAGQLRDVR
jgi:hypothetical protein